MPCGDQGQDLIDRPKKQQDRVGAKAPMRPDTIPIEKEGDLDE